uniref:Uncharacterized protein n=1 Tax=Arundo donax TaxID=35708 RepID=A0A0A9GIX4_ARUDO
MHKGQLLRC